MARYEECRRCRTVHDAEHAAEDSEVDLLDYLAGFEPASHHLPVVLDTHILNLPSPDPVGVLPNDGLHFHSSKSNGKSMKCNDCGVFRATIR